MKSQQGFANGPLPCVLSMFLTVIVLLVPAFVLAAQIDFPLAAYTSEELVNLREWEKTWVGKKITADNIDQVAEFLPAGNVRIFKEQKSWGAPKEGFYFYIQPYKRYIETEGLIKATRKYAPSVKLTADGEIANYAEIAGVPFPNPTKALEIAYNFDLMTLGDSWFYYTFRPVIEPGTPYERVQRADSTRLYWIHRVDVDPRPAFAENPKGIHHGHFMHMYDPPESKNSRFYNLRYIDPAKGDDGYMYYSPFRRLRRMGAASRTDSIDGSDQIFDDAERGWDAHIQKNTYKYLGKKEVLCSRRLDVTQIKRQPGQAVPNNLIRERLQCFVLEAHHKDPNYLYGKRVWYLDPETYHIYWQTVYDRQGRQWKLFEYFTQDFQTEAGEIKKAITGNITYDLQRTHASFAANHKTKIGMAKVNTGLFTVRNLQKGGY